MKRARFMVEMVDSADRIPIREISRVTGVNSVTLRAWERRYGLLKPKRTAKGHRLYSLADVNRVKEIQTWLSRGLAIGKVKSVLADTCISSRQDSLQEDHWTCLSAELEILLRHLDGQQVDKFVAEIFALYPPDMIADKLLTPLLTRLKRPGFATVTQLAFLHQHFVEKLYTTCSYQRQNSRGAAVVIVKLQFTDDDLLPLLLTYGLLIQGYRAEYWGTIPREEWLFVIEKCQPRCLILYSESVLRTAELQQLRKLATKTKTPLLISGKAVCLLDEESFGSEWFLGENIQQTLAQVNKRFSVVERE